MTIPTWINVIAWIFTVIGFIAIVFGLWCCMVVSGKCSREEESQQAKSPAPAPTGNGADGNTQQYDTTKEDACQ